TSSAPAARCRTEPGGALRDEEPGSPVEMRTRPAFTRSIVTATALASTLTFSGCTAGADDDASAGGDTAGTSQQPPAVTPEEETAGEPAEEAGDGPAAGAL